MHKTQKQHPFAPVLATRSNRFSGNGVNSSQDLDHRCICWNWLGPDVVGH